MTSAHTKGLTYSPTNVGIEQEYWQSPFLSPQHSIGWIGQDKGKDIRWQDTSNAKAWGKSLRRLNRTTRSDPSLLANNKLKPFSKGGRVGNFKAKLLQTVHSRASCQDNAVTVY